MQLGMIGLGKMGANMGERLVAAGHRVVGFDLDAAALGAAEDAGIEAASDMEDLVARLAEPRAIWMMLPAGGIVDSVIGDLLPMIAEGDVLIDGGNSNYKDTMRRASALEEQGVRLVDVGTSGGIWGLTEGYSMMVGGDKDTVERLRPMFEALAPSSVEGWARMGPVGSGHFVKMIHNGIEYGLMEAYAEGFALLRAKEEFNLDLHGVAEVWRHGSVVRSWLLDLIANALADNPAMDGIAPFVPDSGEGRWTVFEAIDLNVEAPVIALSLMRRIDSRDPFDYSDRLLAAMRNQFGGHAIKEE